MDTNDKPENLLRDYLRLIGAKGGKARAAKLTAKRRQEIARKAVQAREAKKKRD